MTAKKETRSKKAFCETLIALSKKKSLQNITISELSKISGYSRGSFYAQFESLEDFVRTIVEDEIQEYVQTTAKIRSTPSDAGEYPIASFLALFEYIYSKKDLYSFIFTTTVPSNIAHYFSEETFSRLPAIELEFSDTLPDVDSNFYNYISSYVQKACIMYWIKHDFDWTPKKMAEQCTLFYKKTLTDAVVQK